MEVVLHDLQILEQFKGEKMTMQFQVDEHKK